MSKYTTQLRYLQESGYDIGLKEYPLFDETYREHLNKKIIAHYMFYEIGFETPEMFKVYLNNRMNEIMPYYNQLYLSEDIKFDPLENVNKTEIMDKDILGNQKQVQDSENTSNKDTNVNSNEEQNTTSENTSTTTTNNDYLKVASDTPQDLISFLELSGDKWASQAERGEDNTVTSAKSNDETTTHSHTETIGKETTKSVGKFTGNQDNKTQEDYTLKIKGKSEGESYSDMLLKYRQTFLNIDMMIISDLKDLFMMIW